MHKQLIFSALLACMSVFIFVSERVALAKSVNLPRGIYWDESDAFIPSGSKTGAKFSTTFSVSNFR